MKYTKETPRITVKFIDGDTEDEIFELKNKNWMNIGDVYTDSFFNSIIEQHYKNKKVEPPENIMVLAVAEFNKTED